MKRFYFQFLTAVLLVVPSVTAYADTNLKTSVKPKSMEVNTVKKKFTTPISPPVITSMPYSGASGSSIIIIGNYFSDDDISHNIVYFGSVRGEVTAATATTITVTVPAGATASPVTVINSVTGMASSTKKSFIPTFTLSTNIIKGDNFYSNAQQTTLTAPINVQTGDFNNDGRPDLLVLNNQTAIVYLNTNSSGSLTSDSFIEMNPIAFGNATSQLQDCVTADFNNDGQLDIAIKFFDLGNSNFGTFKTNVYTNNGNGIFSEIAVQNNSGYLTGQYGFTKADMDGDGRLDLIITAEGQIRVYKNNGTNFIYFNTNLNYYADRVVVADMNNDGNLDIICSNRDADKPSIVLLSNGSGINYASTIISATGGVNDLRVEDIDGDGKLDVIMANGTGIAIYKNSSSITTVSFENVIVKHIGNAVTALTLADLDGDGKIDIGTLQNTGKLALIKNNSTSGNISLDDPVYVANTSTATQIQAFVAADFDGDGQPDLAVPDNIANRIALSKQDQNYTVATPTVQTSNLNITAIADLAVTINWTKGDGRYNAVFVKLGNGGNANPTDLSTYTAGDFGAGTQIGTTGWFCVYNGLGNSTIIKGLQASTEYQIMAISYNGSISGEELYNVNTTTNNPITLTTMSPLMSVTSLFPDKGPIGTTVVIAGSGFDATASNNVVYFGAVKAIVGNASTTSLTVTVPIGASYKKLTVLNKTTNLLASSHHPFMVTYPNAKSTVAVADYDSPVQVSATSNFRPSLVVSGDLDGDGKVDYIALPSGAFSSYRNTANTITNTSFTRTNHSNISSPDAAILVDLDNDGKLDLVASSFSSGVYVALNNSTLGSISFTTATVFGSGAYNCLTVGDFNNDGKQDLAVGTASSSIMLFINTSTGLGNISFTTSTLPITGPATFIDAKDIDGDGRVDLAAANRNSGRGAIDVLRNNGVGTQLSFSDFISINSNPGWTNIRTFVLEDLNGDGKIDLALHSGSNGSIANFVNNSSPGAISFAAYTTNPSFSGTPEMVNPADLNGDGLVDYLTTPWYIQSPLFMGFSFIYNVTTTDISLTTPGSQSFGTPGFGFADIADLDGDGRNDLIYAHGGSNNSNGNILMYRYNVVLLPSIQAANLVVSNISAKQANLSWTNGNALRRMVFVKVGNSTSDAPSPVDNTIYTANANLGTGSQIGTSGWYAVYAGAGSSTVVSGLSPTSSYQVMVVEYNTNGTQALYLSTTATNNPRIFTTQELPIVTSFSPTSGPIGTVVTITGTGFNATAENNIVFFGATKAAVTNASATSLTVTVPAGASYEAISVLNTANNLTGYAAKPFALTAAISISRILADDFDAPLNVIVGGTNKRVLVADLDNDGKPEVITTDAINFNIKIFKNNTSGAITSTSLTLSATIATTTAPVEIVAKDLDGDGYAELVYTTGTTVNILQNKGGTDFNTKLTLNLAAAGNNIAISDLNKDGKPDIVVSTVSTTVNIFKNQTITGTFDANSFAAQTQLISGAGQKNILIGDLDSDGKLDLIATSNSTSLEIYPGTSTGSIISFGSRITVAQGQASVDINIADLNDDGKPDLVNSNSNSMYLMRNTSTGPGNFTFVNTLAGTLATATMIVDDIQFADFDGDGKVDIAYANTNTSANMMGILRNTSTASALSTAPYTGITLFTISSGLGIGDIDGDGRPDLVAATGSPSLKIVHNNPILPPTTPSSAINFTAVTGRGIELNWTSGNGTNRVVFVKQGAAVPGVTATNGTNYVPNAFGLGTQLGTSGYYCVYNGNGNSAITGGYTPNTAYSFLILEYVSADPKQVYATTGATADITTGIGAPVITSFSPTTASVGTSITLTGQYFDATPTNNIVFFGATMATVTAASATSLTVMVPTGATVNQLTVLNTVSQLTGYSKTGFNTVFTPAKPGNLSGDDFEPTVQLGTGVSPNSLAIGDIDGDGKSDLVLLDNAATNVVVYRNTASVGAFTNNSFAAPVSFPSGTNGVQLALADLDGDGKLDIGVVNGSSFTIALLKNRSTTGTITFDPKVDVVVGSSALNSVAFGDVDQDGKIDMVTASSIDVSIFRNQGTGLTFSLASSTAYGNVTSIALGDLNNDGKPEIISTSTTENIKVLRNNSTTNNISFVVEVSFSGGASGSLLSIADLNNDGKPDLALATTNDQTFAWYNTTTDGGTITGSTLSQVMLATTPGANLVMGDLNGDGKPDGILRLNNNLIFARNTSSTFIGFAAQKTFDHALTPQTLAIGDLDGDGRNDVIVVNTNGTISAYRNRPVFAPVTPASNIVFSNVTFAGAKLTWTNGSGEKRAVFAKLGNSGTFSSTDLTTYTANAAFGTSPQLDVNGWYCVYNGTGNTVDITNVLDNTDYQLMVVECNGSAGNEVYLTTSATNNPATVKTAVITLPTTPASNITFTNTTINTTTINWTNGDGVKRAVFMFLGNTGTPAPVNLTTYTANTIFGNGASQIGATGWYCVYNGTGNTVNVTNLVNTTAYQVMVVEYNGLASREQYLTTTVATNPAILNTVAVPRITAFSPTNGAIGTSVTITGANFGATAANNIVYFGSVKAQLTAASSTSITVTVPVGAINQPILVLNTTLSLSVATTTAFNTTFSPTKTPINAGDFTRLDFPIGGMPRFVTVGDLDNDGKNDLVVTNSTTGNVMVYRNHASSGAINVADFDAPILIAQGTLSNAPVKLADLDNDGKLDLIVGNSISSISIFRNTTTVAGSITFAIKSDVSTSSVPSFIQVTDLDLDGKPDVVCLSTSQLMYFRNTSVLNTLSFGSGVTSASGATGLGIGDLNADNKPDIVVANGSNLLIYRNTSTAGSTPSFIQLNVVAATGGKTPIVTDINNDGKQDIVVGYSTGTNFSVVQSAYDGVTFNAATFARTDFAAGAAINALTVGDIDGDGKIDVITANKSGNSFSVIRNTTTTSTSFAAPNLVPTDLGPSDLIYADLDGDGKGDVITVNQGAVNNVSIFRYNQLLAPTTAATDIVFSNTKPGSTTLIWTNGNGAKRAVFAYLGNTTTPAPVNLTTYTANIGFGLGTQIGTTGWFCVYNGTANTTTVENLADLSEYQFMVVEYNGAPGYEAYLTTSAQNNPATLTTIGVVAPTVQASNITTTNLSSTGVTLNFAKGDGSLRAVFMLLGNTGTPAPGDLITYTANATFGTGTQIGTTGWYCVYKGFDATANVGGLAPATTYQTMVVEFNGQAGKELYLTSTATLNPISFTTDTPPTVTAFSPKSGFIGSSVTITGTGFNTTQANNIVYFGGTKATVTAASTTSLTVTVPAGATYQPLSVTNTNNNLTGYSAQPYKTTFPNKTTMALTDFSAKIDLAPSSSTNTYATVVGDLNSDGKLDIVATNATAKTISVYKNNVVGNNGFAAADFTMQEITTTLTPRYALLQDFNGDGKLDLAVSTAEAFVLVYQNTTIGNGPITFGTPQQLAISVAGGMGLAAGDLDNDGKPDLAVAVGGSTSTATVGLLRNTSNFGIISFNPVFSLTGTVSTPYNVALRDINGDGKVDLLATGSVGTAVVVYRNIMTVPADFTTGMFAAKISSATGGQIQSLAVGDIDDDANATVDIVSGTVPSSAIYMHKNTTVNGATTVVIASGAIKTFAVPYADLALSDLDGDGKLDLVSAGGSLATVAVFKNAFAATGIFTFNSFGTPFNLTANNSAAIVAIGDLDGDGKPDIITANRNNAAAGLSLIRNNPVVVPAGNSYSLAFSSITKTGTTLSWASGNGIFRLVFMKIGNAGTANPVDATPYTANATFGSGDQIGTSGWYCVYSGTGNTVDVNGLTKNTAYQVMVIDSQIQNTYVFYNRTTQTNNPNTFNTVSDDATLSAINVSNGTLTPTFAAATTNYSVSVNKNVTSITITPTITNANATVTVAGTTPATAVSLTAGSNPITIAVTAQDGTTIKNYVVDVTQLPNVAPINILLINAAIDENVAAASTIGTLSATDIDGTLFTYSFAMGTGDTDNAAFSITGNTLKINASPDYETKPSYSIRLLVTDDGGLTFEKTFVISIDDLLDNPLINSSATTLTAFSTTYGTASASQPFNVSGTFIADGILVTPPTGFEVSTDNTTFATTATIGTTGTITSTPVYVRLKANAAGSPSGNIALTSTNATLVNVAIPASTVTAVLPTITPLVSTNITKTAGTFNATVNDGGAATTVKFLIGTDSTAVANGGGSVQTGTGNNLYILAGTGNVTSSFTDVVFSAGTSYYCRVQAVNSIGTVNSTVIKIIALPAEPVLAVSGNSGTTISLNWLPLAGAVSYLVDVATISDFTTLVTGKSDLTTATSGITISGLSATTQYYVRAKAVLADGGTGAYAATASVLTQTAPAFMATYNFNSSATASLTDPTPKPGVDNVTFGNFKLNGATARTLATRFAGQDWEVSTAIDETKYYEVTVTPTAGYRLNLTNLNFDITRASSAAPNKHVVRSSIDNYTSNLDGTISPANSSLTVIGGVFTNTSPVSTLQVGSNLNLTGFTDLTTPVTFRIYAYNALNGTTPYFALDNVKFTGTTTQIIPEITSSETSIATMATTYGVASIAKTFNISATDAIAGILVTPPSDFEVSLDNETFGNTVTVGTLGTIAATAVYVRLKNNLPVGNDYTGNIVLTTSGATTKNVAVAASTVGLGIQTISFAALANKTFGDSDFSLTATGGASGNAVTYTSSNTAVATVLGDVVTIVGAGASTITASQAAGGNYAAATSVDQTLTVGKVAQTIAFAALANKTFGGTNFSLTATGGASGNSVTYTSSDTNVATVSGSTVTIVGVGTTTITASQLGNGNYTAATSVDQDLTVGKASQIITFATITDKNLNAADFQPGATTTSGLAISYTSSDPTVAIVYQDLTDDSKWKVKVVGSGATAITAIQAGNGQYNSASLMRTLTVVPVTLPVTLTSYTAKIDGNRTRLAWTTASEQQNDRFEIERSADGRTFTYMTTVKGNGTTSNSHTYAVYDNNPGNGTTYYRLKQYDLNGRVEDFGVKSVTFKVEAVVSVVAFPNPTADVVNLSFANYKGQNANVVITDVLGRTIHTQTIMLTNDNLSYKLNMSGKLMPGQYFINVTGENLKTVIKLIAY